MESLTSSNLSVIALSVFFSSLLGSVHCMGMCGGIAMVTSHSFVSSFFYHLGRLLGYLALGFILSLVGQEILASLPSSLTALISPISLGLIFTYLGITLLFNKRFHLPLPPFFSRLLGDVMQEQSRDEKRKIIFPLLIGVLSFTLPCGWLYGFVIGSATTNSTLGSIMIMFMFWLGTIPILVLSPALIRKLTEIFRENSPKVAGGILILSGLFTIGSAIYRVLIV